MRSAAQRAFSDGHPNTTTPEAAVQFKKASSRLVSMSLVKVLKDFNLRTSFKIMVKLGNTRRLARASATTTTTSTRLSCCQSAASELLQARLRLFEAQGH